jgi:hypothetical protein
MNRQKEYIIHLMGGLGNQLFQIAAGLNFSLSENVPLKIDDTYGNFRKNQSGQADILTYQAEFISTSGLTAYKQKFLGRLLGLLIRMSLRSRKETKPRLLRFVLSNLTSILLTLKLRRRIVVWSATDVGYERIPLSPKTQYLIGYFQTYRFAELNKVKSLMSSLTLQDKKIFEYTELAKQESPLIVHIRLGDYLQESDFGVLSKEYYDRAISLMVSKYKFERIWVFSDEIENAKSYIPNRFMALCRWIDDHNDSACLTLEKMRLGHGYVIGNSSFSWWGAYLTRTISAPTIAPYPWFIRMKQPNELLPPNWITIER